MRPLANFPSDFLDRQRKLTQFLKQDLPRIAGVEAIKLIERNFQNQAFVDAGSSQAWPARKQPDIASPILTRRAHLRNAARARTRNGTVEVGIDLGQFPQAKILQEGGTIPVSVKMRRFFWAMAIKFKDTPQQGFWLAMTRKKSINIPILEILKIFLDTDKIKSYLSVVVDVKYDGKPLNKVSAGQRGTAFLCIKLATNTFSEVIVFDQPEDDLDNEFIIKELVDIFKEIKKFRQVIIVTHNANLVVNSDAEQVIVAKNENEILSYISGSLENPQIISEVCNILEGGKAAFEQRRNKYHIN